MTSETESEEAKPVMSGMQLREHRERIIADADKRESGDLSEALSALLRASEDRRERFRLTMCNGGEDYAAKMCSAENELACEFARDEACPKRKVDNERAIKARRREWLEEAGVSKRVLRAVFDGEPKETEATRLLTAATSREGNCLVVLQGGVGCGKSCAAALWAVQSRAHWITSKTLARLSAYDEGIKKLEQCQALVIDDLGTEYADAKGFFLSNLDGLIDARYADELPTVITTNVASEEFKMRYGARIADRIRGAGAWVEVGGASLRVRK